MRAACRRWGALWAWIAATAAACANAEPTPADERRGPSPLFPPPSIDLAGQTDSDVPDWLRGGEVRLAQSSQFVNEATAPALDPDPAAPLSPDEPQRRIFQGFTFVGDTIPRLGDDSLGESSISAKLSLGFPLPVIHQPILVSPRWGAHWLDGPNTPQLPARLNDFEVGFFTFRPVSERWVLNLGVTVGVYGDDVSLTTSEALRVSGLALALFQQSPEWQWALGVVATGRDDIPIVPAFGLVHEAGQVKYEIMLPRPRIVRRLGETPSGGPRAVYLAGEFGGGVWAVARPNLPTDRLNVSRYGVLVGYEGAGLLGAKNYYEVGYLFGRRIEFGETGESFGLNDSLVVRLGTSF